MSGAGNQLYFRGALALPEDSEPSLIVDLRVEDSVVIITQDNEELGVWRVEDVNAERLNGQKFRLQLGEDEVIFHARDRAGFAYTGMNALTAAKARVEESQRRRGLPRFGDSLKALLADGMERLQQVGPGLRNLKPERQPRPEPVPNPKTSAERPAAATPAPTAPEVRPTDAPADLPKDDASQVEPWNLGPTPAQTQPRRRRSRSRPIRRSNAGDDPWAMVADDVLRRDAQPAPPKPRRRTRRSHDHDFTQTALSGGLVRLVCECGEVRIKSES